MCGGFAGRFLPQANHGLTMLLARFTPMDFVLPPLLWLGVGKRSLGWRILNWTIVVGYSGIAIAGAPSSCEACGS